MVSRLENRCLCARRTPWISIGIGFRLKFGEAMIQGGRLHRFIVKLGGCVVIVSTSGCDQIVGLYY
jgi:hypothetical protein